MIAYATLEKPIGQPDSCALVRRESPGLDDTKLRMLRGANLAPSATLTRSASEGSQRSPRLRVGLVYRRCVARGETAGEPSPKAAIGCNRLQFSIVEWIERPRLSPYNRHVGQNVKCS